MSPSLNRVELLARFIAFAGVGATGTAIHMASLWLALTVGVAFFSAQGYAVVAAMTWNFLVNNAFTYGDRRLRGGDIPRGLASFYAVAALGALVNLTVADLVFIAGAPWWLAALSGAAAGLGWNFSMTRAFTWGRDPAG